MALLGSEVALLQLKTGIVMLVYRRSVALRAQLSVKPTAEKITVAPVGKIGTHIEEVRPIEIKLLLQITKSPSVSALKFTCL